MTKTPGEVEERPMRGELEPAQYAKRDAAWAAFAGTYLFRAASPWRSLQDAFNAGWEARKSADYDVIEGRVVEMPRRQRPWGTLS